jgi:hypothetical protein
VDEYAVAGFEKRMDLVHGQKQGSIHRAGIAVGDRPAAKVDPEASVLLQKGRERQSLVREIVVVLEAQDGGNAEFTLQPGEILDARVFAEKETRKDFRHVRWAAAQVKGGAR